MLRYQAEGEIQAQHHSEADGKAGNQGRHYCTGQKCVIMIRYNLTKVHISWIVVILNKVSHEKQTADPSNPTPTVFKYHYGVKDVVQNSDISFLIPLMDRKHYSWCDQ